MSTEIKKEIQLEIAHVLFVDIVGYSNLLINEQRWLLETLNQIVRGTEQFRTAEANGRLITIPTGDGMALVFYNTPEAPVECALEISRAVKEHPELKLRMGVHSGPVSGVMDVTGKANVAGAGINIAQRVMDCGDAGHILLSKHVAEDLEQYPHWQPLLHDLGECEVKHGVHVHVVNLYTEELGNPEEPEKFKQAAGARKAAAAISRPLERPTARRWAMIGAVLLMIAAVVTGLLVFLAKRSPPGAITSTVTPEKSIAVLPFENLSRDPDNAYFADGIQDEIVTRLAKIAALKVISHTSTQKYKSAPDNLREIGKQLGVANLLEGSVQKIANAVHVNVQLIRAATDEHLWAESYNRKLDDVFGVEGEVASAIAEQLNAKLTGAEEKAVTDKPTQNAAAYDAYLHAVSLEQTRSDIAGQKDAASNYATAVRLDPKFALAWARLAIIRSFFYFNGEDTNTNSASAVKQAADQAIALQPQLGEALVAQGVYRYRVLRDFPGALQDYAEALKRLPNNSLVLQQMAHVERRLGQWDAAEKHYRAAAELDPRNVDVLITFAEFLYSLRRFNDAEAMLDHVLQISPGDESALATKAFEFQDEGRLGEAAKELSKVAANSQEDEVAAARSRQFVYERRFDEAVASVKSAAAPDFATDPRTIARLGYWQEWAGRKGEARATFARAIAAIKPSPDSVVSVDARNLPCYLALAYAGVGDKEKALQQAQRALADYKDDVLSRPFAEQVVAQIQARFGDSDSAIAALPHLLEAPGGLTRANLRINPMWDPLRGDPRFQKLCEEKPH